MKREGHQHGLVRTCRILPSPWNPRPNSRIINRFDSPPTSGLFTKVSSKPSNHSKFTGKCGKPRCNTCHLHPVSKSKDKSKGSSKLNNFDLVVHGRPGLNFSGFSASRILDHLGSDYLDDEVDDDDYDGEYDPTHDDGLTREFWSEQEEKRVVDMGSTSEVARRDDDDDDVLVREFWSQEEEKRVVDMASTSEVAHTEDVGEDDDSEEDAMSFCDVGVMFDGVIEEGEDWCLIGEIDY